MRLDKLLANSGYGTRKEVKKIIKSKQVLVNNEICVDDSKHVDPNVDEVMVDDILVEYSEFIYIMLNKPAGYLSATEDMNDLTVLDLLPEYSGRVLRCVGRLDKDTEGLLILTNDGNMIHHLTSPKRHVEKEYYVELESDFDISFIDDLKKGIRISDEEVCLPAMVEVKNSKVIHLTITEGKFHQVKRMMHACNNEVLYLKRLRIGSIILDEKLELSAYRKLTKEEENSLH